MNAEQSLRFKIACEEDEFEQIFQLNYKTFVEEIPQHAPNPEKRLVDRFHHQNTYLIGLDGDQVIGMMAVRDQRPFSLDEKLGNVDPFLPPGRRICEIRLLSVAPTHRNGLVFQGLLKLLLDYGRSQHYNLAIISGTVRQQKLYKHLGFVPFGPLVGAKEAQFQPMYLTLEEFEEVATPLLNVPSVAERAINPISFLPGPVSIRHEVRAALDGLPVSHRSEGFKEDFARARLLLCQLVQAQRVQILLGSGTLANDLIAAQLSLLGEPGVVLSNGEFGGRLIDQSRRAGLSFETLELDWGGVFDREQIRQFLDRRPAVKWLWAALCETSTGVMNDVAVLKELCADRGIRLCLDGISAIGTVPVDLQGVYLASCVSGKGLGAFPGLSMVFHHHDVQPQPEKLPRYLDLGYYAAQSGVPFTQSSNLIAALNAALKRYDSQQPFAETVELSAWLRPRLRELGFKILAPDAHSAPAVVTLILPDFVRSQAVGDQLRAAGLLVSYQSEYLQSRNWIQICMMGDCSRQGLVALLTELRKVDLNPAGRS
ncbi:MAG TPA: aminotransferase class V-fold PLP-dependent enzyme [Candidatus Nitrosotalea sp.]|nr:aminotransferase class V-fold PLP-dependent enzyme [Candidatus Nitrosotalea sp.]